MEIERSNGRRVYTPAELRAKCAESKRFWESPEGKAEAQRQAERRSRGGKLGTRFPKLANKSGTAPEIARRRLLDRL